MSTDDSTNKVSPDYSAAVALLKVAQRDYAAGLAAMDNSTVTGAKATHAAFTAGLVGKDCLYPTVQEFANLFTREVDGQPVPMSRVTVTLWRRLGKFLALGGEAHTATWKRLVQHANDSRVSKVIDADNATVSKVTKAINALYNRKGEFLKAAKPVADGNGGESTGNGAETGESGTTGVTVPNSVPAMIDTLETLALNLATGRNLTPAEAERIGAVIDTLNGITTVREDAALAGRKTA